MMHGENSVHGEENAEASLSSDGGNSEERARYVAKAKARKRHHDALKATRTARRGLIIVHTGAGKGKSTAAFGMVVRSIAHGLRVAIVQFVKGKMASGERDVFARFPEHVVIDALGEGFSWETQDRERDRTAAKRAWDVARKHLADGAIGLVVLDEINIALKYDQLALDDVLNVLRERPDGQHVVLTGRHAAEALIAEADLVTEMRLIKHPFRAGVAAQAGIDF